MSPRTLVLLIAAAALWALPSFVSAATEGDAEAERGAVVVADVRGPLDQRTLDYLERSVRTPDAQLVVIQLDAPGIASGDPQALIETLRTAEVATAMWVGPDGAEAYGGAGSLLFEVDVVGAAPGAAVGWFGPAVAGEATGSCDLPADGCSAYDERVVISETSPPPAFIDTVTPTIGQFIASVDGLGVDGAVLETVEPLDGQDVAVVVPSVEVRFTKPGLFTRTLRLAIRPEAAFFFLVAGLSLVAFEFYAAGAGVAAAVAALSLGLAGYGLAVLPVNWWAVAATVAGIIAYAAEFQRNALGLRSVVGSALLLGGGLTLTRAAPQFAPRVWAVVLIVVAVAAFFVFALATVVRSRFSTPTIGREHLIGRRGTAETGFDPEGIVVVDGARWRARSHRAAGLGPGDDVEVLEVKGIVLEVAPPAPQP